MYSISVVLLVAVFVLPIVRSTNDADIKPNFSSPDTQLLLKAGRKEYESLLEKRNQPGYGKCWSGAIERLEGSCHRLDEHRQSWLAILFTTCFLRSAGTGGDDRLQQDRHCQSVIKWNGHGSMAVSDAMIPVVKQCAKSLMDSNLFHTYTLFFVHTQSICFYLLAEKWQQNTETLVNNLVRDAHIVSGDINSAVLQIRHLEQMQNSSLAAQATINQELAQTKNHLEAFQRQTREQQDLIQKIVTQITIMQDFLMAEFTANSAVVFYLSAMVVVYFITTPRRTIGIRSVLYLILILCFFFEKNGFEYLVMALDGYFPFTSTVGWTLANAGNAAIHLNRKIWMLRKCMLFTMAMIYLWRLVTFTDITELNHRLLAKNTRMLADIQSQLSWTERRMAAVASGPMKVTQDEYGSDYDSDWSGEESETDDDDFECDQLIEEENFPIIGNPMPESPTGYNFRPRSRADIHHHHHQQQLPAQYRRETVSDFAGILLANRHRSRN